MFNLFLKVTFLNVTLTSLSSNICPLFFKVNTLFCPSIIPLDVIVNVVLSGIKKSESRYIVFPFKSKLPDDSIVACFVKCVSPKKYNVLLTKSIG